MTETNKQNSTAVLSNKYILRWFSPRWFVFVMGTGALANIMQMLAGKPIGALHNAAVFFLMTAVGSFAIALFFMIVRFFVGLDCILKEWRHSSLIQFYSAISIAAAVCATGMLNIPLAFISKSAAQGSAVLFWWIACVVGLFFIFFTPYKVITGIHAEPRRALGFWFLPPVGLFVLVFAGNFLAMHLANMRLVYALLLFNSLIFGLAVVLTVIMFTVIVYRALFYNFPRKDVAPSFMIGMAPIGVSIIALNTILPVMQKIGLAMPGMGAFFPLIKIISLLLLGFGMWWMLLAAMLIGTYFLKEGIPVTLGYWAFIFPPAAYTIAALILAKSLGLPFLYDVAVVLTVLLVAAWVIIFVLTIKGALNRTIFDVSPTFKGDIPYL